MRCPSKSRPGCLAHARRKFDELLREDSKSAVATEVLQHIARIYRVERELASMAAEDRLAGRNTGTRPLWKELHTLLGVERGRVPDGSATARAIDYSLNHWATLTHHLLDGEVYLDNNSIESLVRLWAMGPWDAKPGSLRAASWQAGAPPSR